ncbi:unnamed protein product [Phaedon cochleariae]|uniref:ABC1 atypical kinase-like domain-containing protein n=1 Tax=Phaedon cochleariae TaxID=80249 RepID=A0A9P0GTY2_PHACE|nr:unnamed protein product [Phaedon cochleariae]
MSGAQDITCLLRSFKLIAEAGIKLQGTHLCYLWRNSSIPPALGSYLESCKNFSNENRFNFQEIGDITKDGAERLNTVFQGLLVYGGVASKKEHSVPIISPEVNERTNQKSIGANSSQQIIPTKDEKEHNITNPTYSSVEKTDRSPFTPKYPIYKIKLTDSDKELLQRLDMEHRAKLIKATERQDYVVGDEKQLVGSSKTSVQNLDRPTKNTSPHVVSVPNPKSKQKLSDHAKQRKVPSSRIGRMVSFGTLAAGLGIGTATEYAKRSFGMSDTPPDASSLFMSKANMDRIVDTLCKVRGAALKLGQILSIQDESIVNSDLAKALERVRKSADFMPNWQVEQVMSSELGPSWRDNFLEFQDRPFAAASIGQVHQAKLKDGSEVAIKIQYPGVARGIESDINNLGGIMKMWNVFPKGMFLENLMTVAKRELAWEVDYVREAECTKKFRDLLAQYEDYRVPSVIDELSTKQVFTTELLDGIPVDQCFDLDLEHREFIGEKIMELVLLEIMKFRYMQTDPNWANFLYSPEKKQLLLLDFGASREYSKEFTDQYVKILKAACDSDRDTVLRVSKDLGFLTGYESKLMEEAHVDAVMILGEVFRAEGKYNFGSVDMVHRLQDLAQIMIVHRLCPPPEEVYSLHRKLSGVFLLCSKLKISLSCRDKFLRLYDEYVDVNKL